MPPKLKNAALLFIGRVLVKVYALLGDPGGRILALRSSTDPYTVYETVRAKGVLVQSRMGMHITASHQLCDSLARDHRFGVLPAGAMSPVDTTARVAGRRLVNPVEESFLVRNPPDHTRLRRMVAPFFTPRALRERAPAIERVVEDFLDDLAERPRFDVVRDYAIRVPIQVIADLLGVPEADHAAFARWGSALVGALDGVRDMREMRSLHAGLAEFDEFLGVLIAHRRRHPGTDVVSALVANDELSRRDLIATTELLLVAGFETTVNLIGNGVLAVFANPGARQQLLDDPDAFVEEVLRTDPPVQYTVRFAQEPVEIEGVALAKGTPIMMLLAAAGRDPAVFTDPHRFDPLRSNAREHLAFSAGIHYCLGAGLARMEAAAALRGLFLRFPELRPAGAVQRRPSRIIRGALHLPVSTGAEKRSLAVKNR